MQRKPHHPLAAGHERQGADQGSGRFALASVGRIDRGEDAHVV
jgi:hypothetical protein